MSINLIQIFSTFLILLANKFSSDLTDIQRCIGTTIEEQSILDCQLRGGRNVSIFVASATVVADKDSLCFQIALGKAKLLAGSHEKGHSVDSSYQKVGKLDSNSLTYSVSQRVESELTSKVSGLFEVYRLIQHDKCYVGVSRNLADLVPEEAITKKSQLVIKGRPPFKNAVLGNSHLSSMEGAAIVRMPDGSYLVVASGMAKGGSSDVKSLRIAETRAQINLGRLFHQEKVYEYTFSETSMHMKNEPSGPVVQVYPQQIFASFVGFSQNLSKLQPVHCHWFDLQNPEQRWALVGFHVSKGGELIPHNQPWGL